MNDIPLYYAASRDDVINATTEELRSTFLVEEIFAPGQVRLHWWETDRAVFGGAVPSSGALKLGCPKALVSEHFCERRELGVLNLGGDGVVVVDGEEYKMGRLDGLYIGRGARDVEFRSNAEGQTARFYLVSYPAHTAYPTTHLPADAIKVNELGSPASCNHRRLRKVIEPQTVRTCQLVMGYTQLLEGSVWNTMPPHTHLRRSEIYLYFDVPQDHAVFHFMGEPDETRHILIHNEQAVLSPPWSIHAGAGTSAYSFVWAMGGENQEFSDMDAAPIAELR